MKSKIYDEIRNTAFYGTIYPGEMRGFNDSAYFTKDNLFKYRLSKIKFFIGEKNEKELILGLQTFYINRNGEEISNNEERDKIIKELDIKTLQIPPNDYICNFFLKTGDDRITQIKLVTQKGKEFIVGSDEGEERIVDFINDNKDYMILYFFGRYRKCLESIGASYISIRSYLGDTTGFFELKRKVKDKSFKDAIEAKLNQLEESDQVLFKVCNLHNKLFYSIIKYCLL